MKLSEVKKFRVNKGVQIQPEDFKNLKYPLLASVKLDGIRATLWQDGLFSSSNKPIPNDYTRNCLMKFMECIPSSFAHSMFDGELLVGETFQSCTSGIMSKDGEPCFTYYVFDWIFNYDFSEEFIRREAFLSSLKLPRFIKVINQVMIYDEKELEKFYIKTINEGHEGIIIRSCDGSYKFGRSTLREGDLLKVKPFEDAECEIIGFEEGTQNCNEIYTNERGLTQRSTQLGGKIPNGRLGSFLCKDLKTGVEFKIGTGEGLTIELRNKIWDFQDEYLGKIIKYKSQKKGTKDKPRIPIFIGFRDKEDM